MKIAVLGGGLTGITASYYLSKKKHQVVLFEKEKQLGGMAAGFKASGWDWFLERSYHHWFINDYDIFSFAQETGFKKIFFQEPVTASLYQDKKPKNRSPSFSIYPLDTPLDLFKFPLLSFLEKMRAGVVLAFLKVSPFFSFYEAQTAAQFLKKTMGERTWEILWQELFRKKFGKYAGNVLASFFWARIKKRTKKLGYVKGGFQIFIDYLEKQSKERGIKIVKEKEIDRIEKRSNKFLISGQSFDMVVSTLPTPVLIKIADKIFPNPYLNRLRKIKYLHGMNLIIENQKKLLEKTYWLNVCEEKLPFLGLMQQTNFIDKKHYSNHNILYIVNYVDDDSSLLKMEKEELGNLFLPYLKKINPEFNLEKEDSLYLFKTPFAQPVFDQEFLRDKPNFETPIKNFYIANLDMTYPYDRGTNYAVKLGKGVGQLIGFF